MPYVAHAAVRLQENVESYEKDKWYYIKTIKNIEFRWRITRNLTYEVIAGLFSDKYAALKGAKYMYVTMLYNLLWDGVRIADGGCQSYEKRLFDANVDDSIDEYRENENFFFWTPKYIGGGLGVDVYEVNDSIEEYDEYKLLTCEFFVTDLSRKLDYDNYDKSYFLYNREAQELFNTILIADSMFDIGMQMTIYCGLLEHLAENRDKEAEVLSEINALIQHVKQSDLTTAQKDSLTSYLAMGRKISASQKCKLLVMKYARSKYGKYDTGKILRDAYSIRSTFSHGENCNNRYSSPAAYIKLVVLDVVRGYMEEKENTRA